MYSIERQRTQPSMLHEKILPLKIGCRENNYTEIMGLETLSLDYLLENEDSIKKYSCKAIRFSKLIDLITHIQ